MNIKLNAMEYRYDVYQIVNLFYPYGQINFSEEKEQFVIEISGDVLKLGYMDSKQEVFLDSDINRKEAVKKALFSALSGIKNKHLPWGTMVGIRPSKIALRLMEEGLSEDEIIKYYNKHYLADEDKARLCIEVARAEKNIVSVGRSSVSIYIGMPFCPTRCSYCSFASNPINACKGLVEPYLKALSYEIFRTGEYIRERNLKVESVYFGGGTPTSVSDEQFEDIMRSIYNTFICGTSVKEFTVECGRPDSITERKLLSMRRYEADRISINPQTMNDATLKAIGRSHNGGDVKTIYVLARSLGFQNINMDIIVGLPGEGLKEVLTTCSEILRLKPDSLTVHGMALKRASRLHEEKALDYAGELQEQEELVDMYDATRKLAHDLEMHPYYMYRQKNMAGSMENVGYAKIGKEGIYNIQMIEEKQTIIALGADAVSKVFFDGENRIERFANVKDVREYTGRIEEMVKRKLELLDSLYR